jgi:predicted lactoylglutathione lyase
MINDLWLNLPIKDLKKAKAFYSAVGFQINEGRSNDEMLAMHVGTKKTAVMLFSEEHLTKFSGNPVRISNDSNEVLISFGVDSRNEIDEIAEKAEKAGGIIFGKPVEMQGWMYGCGFVDLDGHRWNALYMDSPKKEAGKHE